MVEKVFLCLLLLVTKNNFFSILSEYPLKLLAKKFNYWPRYFYDTKLSLHNQKEKKLAIIFNYNV